MVETDLFCCGPHVFWTEHLFLGGGFKYVFFMFTPILGMIQFEEHFLGGWVEINHQANNGLVDD